MTRISQHLILLLLLTVFGCQNTPVGDQSASTFVDSEGVWRWSDSNKELSLFGINYTTPFAHAHRRIEQLELDHKQTIDQDVYHFARLGFDAYRVHVWEVEMSDPVGNLIENEHLDLFDYLVSKLKERDISIMLTPLLLGGNGYPDKGTDEPGFARGHHKKEMVSDLEYAAAQRRYLKQFLEHVNPYTGTAYKDEPTIVAIELVNEPWHVGSNTEIADYIDGIIQIVKNTGCKTPVFYNMSQNPYLREVYYDLDIDGFCFQWYPAGLTSLPNTLNLLPYTGSYPLFFGEDPQFKNSAKAVYELSLSAVPTAYAYPDVARTLRDAGFRFAAYFCYDPLAIGAYNSEYPTHYLNLAYTPRHAINLMIAAEVFRGSDAFSINPKTDRSLLNDGKKYFYSNGTDTPPLSLQTLETIAGCGSSPVVKYSGTGAFFLDKLADGAWRLEIMPDTHLLVDNPYNYRRDGSPVADVNWNFQTMELFIPDLGENIIAEPITGDETDGKKFKPGIYLLRRPDVSNIWKNNTPIRNFTLAEYAAPQPISPNTKKAPPDSNVWENGVLFDAELKYKNRMIQTHGTQSKVELAKYQNGVFDVEVKANALSWGDPIIGWNFLTAPAPAGMPLDKLVVDAEPSHDYPCPVRLVLQLNDGTAFAANAQITDQLTAVKLDDFKRVETVRIQSNPSFLPATIGFTGPSETLDLSRLELVAIQVGPGLSEEQIKQPHGFRLKKMRLE